MFDFIFEAYTLQVLPTEMQVTAMREMAKLVAPGGSILVVARGRDDDAPRGEQVPWPLSRKELGVLVESGLSESSFEDFYEDGECGVRRFRGVYTCSS